MTHITREQELALVEALSHPRGEVKALDFPPGLVTDHICSQCGGFHIAPAGRIAAQAIKERDEADHNGYKMGFKASQHLHRQLHAAFEQACDTVELFAGEMFDSPRLATMRANREKFKR